MQLLESLKSVSMECMINDLRIKVCSSAGKFGVDSSVDVTLGEESHTALI